MSRGKSVKPLLFVFAAESHFNINVITPLEIRIPYSASQKLKINTQCALKRASHLITKYVRCVNRCDRQSKEICQVKI